VVKIYFSENFVGAAKKNSQIRKKLKKISRTIMQRIIKSITMKKTLPDLLKCGTALRHPRIIFTGGFSE